MHWSYVFFLLTHRFIPSNIQIGDGMFVDVHDVLHDDVHCQYAKLILCLQMQWYGTSNRMHAVEAASKLLSI